MGSLEFQESIYQHLIRWVDEPITLHAYVDYLLSGLFPVQIGLYLHYVLQLTHLVGTISGKKERRVMSRCRALFRLSQKPCDPHNSAFHHSLGRFSSVT